MAGIKNVFGGAFISPDGPMSPKTMPTVFDALEKGGVKIIDTAALYGESEAILGEAGAGERFIIDTKARGGFSDAGATAEVVTKEAGESHKKLKSTVDIYYLHAPDSKTPLEETLAGIDAVYRKGFFKRFGVSNFKVEEVQSAYDICKAKGYVLPSVYQGNYSAVARKLEEVLLPTLRKLGMSFYAYSPIAGGFLTKTKDEIASGAGRFDPSSALGEMYSSMYNKGTYLEALAEWEAIAKEEGVTRADLAYRWVKYNSPLKPEHGDAIIIGARTLEQLDDTLGSIGKGPLSDKAAKRIDGIWEKIQHEAPLDNFHR